MHTGFCWQDLRERGNFEDLGINGSKILKCVLKKWDGEAWIGLLWLRTGRGGERFWML